MYDAKVGNLSHKNNIRFTEPQKLAYKKEQELTPYELAMAQQYEDGRSDWTTYDDKIDFMDKAGNAEDWD